jgi:hypothetical protein
MHELWFLSRGAAQPRALHYSWERAGLVVADQPIAWCAESVLVEALLRLPPGSSRHKAEFYLRLPGREALPAEQFRRVEREELYRVNFRLPPLPATTTAELIYRDRGLGQLTLPVLSRQEFIRQLRLEMPTLQVRLGSESVACQTFVASQCRGLLASAVLFSSTSLVPLIDLDLEVEFRCERVGMAFRVPVRLTASQLQGKSALVTVAPARHPRRLGTWTATWMIGEHVLARHKARGISQKAFQRSLRISDTRFVVQAPEGPFRLARQAPVPDGRTRVGPCFLVASSEPGMAGLCRPQVVALVGGAGPVLPATTTRSGDVNREAGPGLPPLLLEQEVLVTDGPAMVAPGTLDAADLSQVSGFELRVAGHSLGLLPMCPVPAATFTAEGGFQAPPDYTWTSAAEEEMNDRLNRLLEGRPPPE